MLEVRMSNQPKEIELKHMVLKYYQISLKVSRRFKIKIELFQSSVPKEWKIKLENVFLLKNHKDYKVENLLLLNYFICLLLLSFHSRLLVMPLARLLMIHRKELVSKVVHDVDEIHGQRESNGHSARSYICIGILCRMRERVNIIILFRF